MTGEAAGAKPRVTSASSGTAGAPSAETDRDTARESPLGFYRPNCSSPGRLQCRSYSFAACSVETVRQLGSRAIFLNVIAIATPNGWKPSEGTGEKQTNVALNNYTLKNVARLKDITTVTVVRTKWPYIMSLTAEFHRSDGDNGEQETEFRDAGGRRRHWSEHRHLYLPGLQVALWSLGISSGW